MTRQIPHRLRTHEHTLRDGELVLRPMTEDDWPWLERWNGRPEVLYWAEGDDVERRTPEEVRRIYRLVSEHAFVFVLELDGRPIGEGWLQHMNLEEVRARHPELADQRRIDLMIGEPARWGHGYGTRAIALLTRFAFGPDVGADAVFACDVAEANLRCLGALERNDFVVDAVVERPPEAKHVRCLDFVTTRAVYEGRQEGA